MESKKSIPVELSNTIAKTDNLTEPIVTSVKKDKIKIDGGTLNQGVLKDKSNKNVEDLIIKVTTSG